MSLHVYITGEGPDLVLLHGWALHGGVFDSVLPALAAHYRVHCIDLPGHGRSHYAHSVSNLIQLAERVQPHLPINAMVMGWSLGGLVALQLAQQQAVRALLLISTTPKFVADDSGSPNNWIWGMPQAVFAQFFKHLQQNLDGTVQDFLRLQVRGDADAAQTLEQLKANLLRYPPDRRALERGLEILRDADVRNQLSTIDVPTLVLAGEYDRIAHPEASRYMSMQLPQAKFMLIKRAGHAAFLSHPSAFIDATQNFLASVLAADHV